MKIEIEADELFALKKRLEEVGQICNNYQREIEALKPDKLRERAKELAGIMFEKAIYETMKQVGIELKEEREPRISTEYTWEANVDILQGDSIDKRGIEVRLSEEISATWKQLILSFRRRAYTPEKPEDDFFKV